MIRLISKSANLTKIVTKPSTRFASMKSMRLLLLPHTNNRFYSSGSTTTTNISEQEAKKQMTVNDELPDPTKGGTVRKVQFVTFLVAMSCALALIFNYEKTKSPVVSNSLYQMRRSERIRELLGNSIDLYGMMPWVYGELNQVKGNINITFHVKGTNNKKGTVRLVADRENKHHEFLIHEWSVECDGVKIDLLGEDSNAKIM